MYAAGLHETLFLWRLLSFLLVTREELSFKLFRNYEVAVSIKLGLIDGVSTYQVQSLVTRLNWELLSRSRRTHRVCDEFGDWSKLLNNNYISWSVSRLCVREVLGVKDLLARKMRPRPNKSMMGSMLEHDLDGYNNA